jgi:hypothetical protein
MASLNKSGKTAVAEMDGIIAILAGESTRPNSASNLLTKVNSRWPTPAL